MRKINWKEVNEASDSNRIPAGGYVVQIVDVKDNPGKEYLEIVFDVIEGQYKGIFKGLPADDNWKHRFNQVYSEKALGFFKRFLKELERDNDGFTVDEWERRSDEQDFKGLKLGMLFGEYRYINDKGEAKYSLNAVKPLSIEDVRMGNFDVPDPKYSQYTNEQEWAEIKEDSASGPSAATTAEQTSVYDSSVPF